MVDVLHGVTEDVPFDHATCDDLIAFCNTTASTIEGQTASRANAVTTGSRDFRGHFAEVFGSNAGVARADADELALRLKELARFAGDLKASAEAEQTRRVTARNWVKERQDRNWFQKEWDSLVSDEGDARPPVGPPDPPPSKAPQAVVTGTRQTPAPGSGGSSSGTSSARPAELRAFAQLNAGLNGELSAKPAVLEAKLADFAAKCRWGTLDGSSVVTGFRRWDAANDDDVRWANVVAEAFERAGSAGGVSTLSNSALTAALVAHGVRVSRDDLVIDPAIAIGHPPTTGYALDPVNTATGNFLETEVDLRFGDAAAGLAWARTYNSFDAGIGAFGPGWSSVTEAGLTFTDDAARMRREDGRVSVFPRLGERWDRATGEKLWLHHTGEGYRASDNEGSTWDYTLEGRLHRTATGPGTETTFEHDAHGRLIRISHARGRSLEVTWGRAATGEQDRVVALTASDGRQARFGYDDRGRLTTAAGDRGDRSYRWNAGDLIAQVVDGDGVVEVDNTYDTERRVRRQHTRHGRVVQFTYLPGRTTVVADVDGSRSNTWLHDTRGRLIGVVDADEHRQSMSYDQFGNLVMATERGGQVTVHEYDERGRRIRTVTPTGADLTFGYDDLDRVTTVVTEAGAVTEYAYQGTGRHPSVLRDPEGGLTRFTWDDGLLTEVSDPTDVRVRFGYDEHGELVATTDADGNTARLERDAVGRVTAAITPSGNRTSYTYDAAGRLASRRDPDGALWRFQRTAAGRLSAVVGPLGARTVIDYGAHGEEAATTDALGRTVTRSLDDLGNLASVRLPDGATWQFTHDALSRLTETIDPAGALWGREYDENGDLAAVIDPTGARQGASADLATGTVRTSDGALDASARFDPLGRLVSVEQPDGSAAMASYDPCGRPVELLDGEGGLTRLVRDAAGRVVQVTSPTGAVTGYEYDRCGRLAATIHPLGARTTREYDADGRVIRVVLPTGEAATVRYDAVGRVVAVREPGRGTSRYVYDLAGRLTQSHDTWFGRRTFRYDPAGQLVEVVNGNGGVTRFTYDANGRAVQITDPLGNTTRREFDAANRCVAESDPLGRTIRAGYDGAGRQVHQTDPDGGRTEWAYDATGRPTTTSVDGQVIAVIDRDPRRRTVTITDHTRPGAVTTHELEWNRLGRLVRRTRDGQGVTWAYDGDGRRIAMTTPDGHTTTYTWDAASRLTAVEHPRLGRATFALDAFGRLIEATTDTTAQTWQHHDGYVVGHTVTDADGSTRTRIDRDDDGRVVGVDRDGVTTWYDYDQACQLVAARLGSGVQRWTYDPAGRLVAETTGDVTVEHSYDAAGQLLLSRASDGARTVHTTGHAYDGLGRRRRTVHADGRVREFSWSELGHLNAVTDHAGDQVHRTTTHVDVLGELQSAGGVDLWWDTAAYAPTPVLAGDRPILAAGPVTGIGDTWTVPGWRTARSGGGPGADPWNLAAAAQLPGGLSIGAAGELTIGGSDPLEWLGARVYDPTSRGFLSVDPLDAVPGAGWAGNPYSYAGNDPLHALDPLGLRPATDADLTAYARAHVGPLAGAKDWVANNWEYLAGGAMIIAGGVLIATGVGGPVGMMLVSAGADTIIQKATTGKVNWAEVAVSGALGGIGGAGVAARLGATGLKAAVITGAVSGSIGGAGMGAYHYETGPGPHTVTGLLGATAIGGGEGAVLGGAGGAVGHGLATAGGKLLSAGGAGGHEIVAAGGKTLDAVEPVPSGAANAAWGPKLAEDLAAGEKANPLIESLTDTGQLPSNYVTKAQAAAAGWQPGKALGNYVPGGQLGGDVFTDPASIGLPTAPGRTWHEADIGLSSATTRAKQAGTRLLYSNDGMAYVTPDHYGRIYQLPGWGP
jgi:RHS repeat-associated protein